MTSKLSVSEYARLGQIFYFWQTKETSCFIHDGTLMAHEQPLKKSFSQILLENKCHWALCVTADLVGFSRTTVSRV